MYMRQGTSHVDERSQWVYKIKLPHTSGGNRGLPDLTVLIDRKAAKQIIDYLANDKERQLGEPYIHDLRSRIIEVSRSMIKVTVDGNWNVDTNHHWYNGGDEDKEYELNLTDDWGMDSWQRVLVNLKCWVG